MRLKKLEIKNFRAIKEFELSFKENGLNLIIGPNGSGKTSVLDAISFALYSESLKNLRNQTLQNRYTEDPLEVTLEFEHNNDNYLIKRSLKSAILKKNNKVFRKGKEIKKFISENILNKLTFMNTLVIAPYSAKGRLLSNLSPNEKFLFFKELLNLDQFEAAATNAKERINEINQKLVILRLEEEKLLEEKYQREKEFLEEKKENILKELESLKLEKKKLLERLRELDKKEKEFLKIKEKIIGLEKEIKVLKEEIKKLEQKLKKKENEFYELEKKKILDLENKKNEIKLRLIEKENELKKIDLEKINKINEKKEKIKELEFGLKEKLSKEDRKIKEEINLIKENIKYLKSKIKDFRFELNKKEKELEERKTKLKQGICSECLRPLRTEKDIKKLKERIISLEKKIKDINNQIKEKNDQIQAKENLIIEKSNQIKKIKESLNNEYLKKRDKIISEIETLAKEFETSKINILKEISNLKSELSFIKEKKEKIIENDEELEKISIQLYELDSELREKNKLLDEKEIKYLKLKDHYLLDSIKESKKIIGEQINKIDLRIESLLKENLKIKEELRSLDSKFKAENKRLKEKISEKENEIKIYQFWQKAFQKELPLWYIQSQLKKLEEIANLYSEKINVDLLFDFKINQDKKEFQLDLGALLKSSMITNEEFSTGEFALYSFILTVSLIEYLDKYYDLDLNVIFFDETIDSLDTENIKKVLELIEEISLKKLCYLSSHRAEIKYYINCDSFIDMTLYH